MAAPAHQRGPKSDRLLAGAGKNNLAGSRDAQGGTLAVARLVGCQRVFLDLCVYSNLIPQHAIPLVGRRFIFFSRNSTQQL